MEGYQRGGVGGIMRGKVKGIRIVNCRYKIDRGKLRTVYKVVKPKNLYVWT